MPSRVLIVDDDVVIREIMLRQLSMLGVNCYAVACAEEAVELAEFFDLIFMDIQLPGLSGIEAARLIRKIEREKGLQPTAIVAATGSDTRDACLAAGMDDYCSKPVRQADLERLLNQWVLSQPERLRLLG